MHTDTVVCKEYCLLGIVQYIADGESDVHQVHLVPGCKKPFHSTAFLITLEWGSSTPYTELVQEV